MRSKEVIDRLLLSAFSRYKNSDFESYTIPGDSSRTIFSDLDIHAGFIYPLANESHVSGLF